MVRSLVLRFVQGQSRAVSNPILSPCARRQLHQYGQAMAAPQREEQTLPRFYEKRYYPVRIGQIFHERYQVLTKLGYGAHSTVWLARDRRTDQYTSLKICTRDSIETSPVANELNVLRHVATCPNEHAGAAFARLPDDSFEVDGHSCLVMKPHACSLQQLQNLFAYSRVPEAFISVVVMRLLACINWLQLDCGVVHTEITPQNILLAADDDEIFQRAEKEEVDNPSVPFLDYRHPHPHPIYPSRGLPTSLLEASGHSILTDFGSAKLLKASMATRGWWMPDTYRAPEVLMGLPWDHGVDIWTIGVMVLELLEGRNLFDPIDHVHNQYVLPLALAQYIGYMGLPPLWMIQQSDNPVIATFFDEQGRWIADPPVQQNCFEEFVTVIEPGERKTQFLNFIKKILTWNPAERANSAELFEDEWLTAPFKASGIL